MIEICTDDGRSGWGETQGAPEAAWSVVAQAAPVELLGRDPLEINRIWRAMLGSGRRDDVRMMAADAGEEKCVARHLAARLRVRVVACEIRPAVRRVERYEIRAFESEKVGERGAGERAVARRQGHVARDDEPLLAQVHEEDVAADGGAVGQLDGHGAPGDDEREIAIVFDARCGNGDGSIADGLRCFDGT
ncbi:MAG: hypothetical protein ACHQY2_04075 [Candidatus Eremiobacterales bacterium]